MKPKVIVIVGPTASGKTSLSIELAKKINGEIVSCDSMQIYKDMDIGSAKPTKEEMQGIKHYIIDEVLPTERFSVARYKQEAEKAIEKIKQETRRYAKRQITWFKRIESLKWLDGLEKTQNNIDIILEVMN